MEKIRDHKDGWFDPRIKKLLKNAGYDKGEPRQLEKLDSVMPTKLVDESKVMQGMINGEYST